MKNPKRGGGASGTVRVKCGAEVPHGAQLEHGGSERIRGSGVKTPRAAT